MTKLSTVFLGLCVMLFLGCSDDEEDFLTPLVGTWETYAMTISGCADSAENGTLECEQGPGFLPCISVTVNSNSTYTLQNNIDQSSEAGTAAVTATTLTLCETGSTDCTTLTYGLAGDKLTITFTEDDSPGCLFTLVFTKT